MSSPTYDLRMDSQFVAHIEALTEQFEQDAAALLPDVAPFADLDEPRRTPAEYHLELLSLGLYGALYLAQARRCSRPLLWLAGLLFGVRRRFPALKPWVDRLRGRLAVRLRPTGELKPTGRLAMADLPRLLDWMQATGEFAEEVVRLTRWRRFLEARPDAAHWIAAVTRLTERFIESSALLARVTAGVSRFNRDAAQDGPREDAVLRARGPLDHHLAMVGAEVMNRALRPAYRETSRRVILVPGCMRGKSAAHCRATAPGADRRCLNCQATCGVGQLTRAFPETPVVVIPHASNFIGELRRFAKQPDLGVVASACVLHLLTGGYEMQKLRIPAQCVFLDFAGCQRHWTPDGLAPTLNRARLAELLALRPELATLKAA